MPELPEVETIKNNLNDYIGSRTLQDIVFKRQDIIGIKGSSIDHAHFINKQVLAVTRHGKYLIINFEDSHQLIVHLRMTGKLLFLSAMNTVEQDEVIHHKHSHVKFVFPNGDLIFNDVRRFGKLYFVQNKTNDELLLSLNSGPDALSIDFTKEYFFNRLQSHPKRSIKSSLLDQKLVAGIGNIYADESLFTAKTLPTRPSASITMEEASLLHLAIINILSDAIVSGGTTFSDYRTANNEKGSFQNKLRVYGRGKENCLICDTPLLSEKLSGRTTVYCPNCQK